MISPVGTLLPTHSRVPFAIKAGHIALRKAKGIGETVPFKVTAPPERIVEAWPSNATRALPAWMWKSSSTMLSAAES